MTLASLVNLAYLAAAVLFILGLKGLTHPRSAFRGNLMGSGGMLLAIVVTLLDQRIMRPELIVVGLAIGIVVGLLLAVRIQMTAMPQLVAVFNGFGGGASVLVAAAAAAGATSQVITSGEAVAGVLSGIIGSVTFWGSLVAFGKLQGLITEKSVSMTGQRIFILGFIVLAVVMGVFSVRDPSDLSFYWYVVAAASILGVLLVMPVGGADMPVMIALLNSYSGLAASATGFVLSNNVLIIAGSLVGASGLILTRIMCQAMNRSLMNVLTGLSEASGEAQSADEVYAGKVTSSAAEEIAMLLDTARRVVVVPGYGMAVAQAQHVVRELHDLLESRSVEVEFAIHPVAGRMPGHMNVLLADADVPYDKMKTMDEINSTFQQTDMVFVIGANDIVNPLARTDPNSPIAGMPILDVDKARTVVVIKRSLSPGYAGIPNPLFAMDNTLMLFGDGKKAVEEMVAALKESV